MLAACFDICAPPDEVGHIFLPRYSTIQSVFAMKRQILTDYTRQRLTGQMATLRSPCRC